MSAASLLLRLVLTGTQTHYESRGLIDDKRLEQLLVAGKQILYKSHQESEVRSALGFNPQVWEGLTQVLTVAIPALEQQSFPWKNPPDSGFNGSSSELIAAHYLSLVKDIERLNDLCTIARNLLATNKKAQNLAADKYFDQQILKLIDVCVRVTARGFDGEANPRNEEKWQKVVNLYKRLLITCLQFLHNFIMHNEHRKLVLWLDLFGLSHASEADNELSQESAVDEGAKGTENGTTDHEMKLAIENSPHSTQRSLLSGLASNFDEVHAQCDLMSPTKEPDKQRQEAARNLLDEISDDFKVLVSMSNEQLAADPDALLRVAAKLRTAKEECTVLPSSGAADQLVDNAVASGVKAATEARSTQRINLPALRSYGTLAESGAELTDEDLVMPRTAQSAAATLQEAKDELMARLHESAPMMEEHDGQTYDEDGNPEGEFDDDLIDSVEDSLEDEEDDDDEGDDDYRGSGDQERGLLTDVPLVLGPTEIEALPMIIQAGIVDNFGSKNSDSQGVKNMQAVRCHILLAQEAGRNVLRELLIFIAAWDLPDDEFYFKMMVQIMEAILKNGLMSHAYADFGQPKDIISPAQAVVIKILTHIFRAKYSSASVTSNSNEQAPAKPRIPAPLSRVDILTVRYIFIVFRGNIIPETCALIYLQGQIRAGLALAEDFPLNLWDMERVYEGVYQFLEFFAVLTENNDWKRLLVQWEIVYDLVTLIKELDTSIAKIPLTQTIPPATATATATANATDDTSAPSEVDIPAKPLPHSGVERPYEVSAVEPLSRKSQASPLPDPERPASASEAPPPPTANEEPADFEWRNLKKLIVLVLSSLVWKSPTVQNQIRQYGGVETILSCTQYDGRPLCPRFCSIITDTVSSLQPLH